MPDIRPFDGSNADYEAHCRICNEAFPEYPASVEGTRHRDNTRPPHRLFGRFMVEERGRLVACGAFSEEYYFPTPGRFFLSFQVASTHRNQGIGSALFEHLVEATLEHDPTLLSTWTLEDRERSVQFIERRGFEKVMRWPLSRLDVRTFDAQPFAKSNAKVRESGVEIVTLRQLEKRDAGCKRKVHALHMELDRDIPAPEPIEPRSFEEYAKIFDAPTFSPDGCFVALDADGTYVGLSTLFHVLADPTLKAQGITGVSRTHRRRGIATALKLRTIDYARHQGAHFIQTDNEENNPMFLLNMALGFKPRPAELAFERALSHQ